MHIPRLTRQVGKRLRGVLMPGDVIVVRKEYAITNYFLPGHWPHAALYLGDIQTLRRLGLDRREHVAPRWRKLVELKATDDHRVLESLKDGVRIRSIESPLGSDAVAIIRPRLSETDITDALERAVFHEGKPYDFDFNFTLAWYALAGSTLLVLA